MKSKAFCAVFLALLFFSTFSILKTPTRASSPLALVSINLQSREDDSSSSNLGTITFQPEPYPGYSLPTTIQREKTPEPPWYQACFFPPSRHVHDHWEISGGLELVPPGQFPESPLVSVKVTGPGTMIAVYRFVPYQFTIKAHCYTEDSDVSVSVIVDEPPAHITPYTFTSTSQTHTFVAPEYDVAGHPFKQWSTGHTTPAIIVSAEGTYIAYYESRVHDLGIKSQLQRKDTEMLCLEGCPLTGNHAWDKAHPEAVCLHDDMYCVRAAISMINSHYGGDLSQDRISYYVFEEYRADIHPENDMGHGLGIDSTDVLHTLSWALSGVAIYQYAGKPPFVSIEGWIDEGRPILCRDSSGFWHATVIDGYEETDEIVHVLDPATGLEMPKSYSSLEVFEVWVPPAAATARSDEATLNQHSDGDFICDFDEINRFHTDPYGEDSDGDLISDKIEIRSYTFLADERFDEGNSRDPYIDGDLLRPESDRDSDNGGTPDGLEDLNRNGVVDAGETDPLNPSDDNLRASELRITAHSPVNILVTDPNIRRVGFDPVTQSVINEIPGATYTGPGSEPQIVEIPNSINGTYGISAVGIEYGPFSISMESIDINGSVLDADTWQGSAEPDVEYSEIMALESDGHVILPHDMEVAQITSSRNVVGEQYPVFLNVTFKNQGNYTETFNATIYANVTTAVTIVTDIVIARGESKVVTFVWNTTGMMKGIYNLTAVAWQVPGELDVADNALMDGWVLVTIPGDVEGDGDVDIFDIVKIAGVYGTETSDPQYDIELDVDCDGEIDIFDIVAAACHYGESW